MPCDPPNQEWTIFTSLDSQPEANRRRLIFCLSINGGSIMGAVKIMTSGGDVVDLSDVTGHHRVLTEVSSEDPTRPAAMMTLNFNWGPRKVMLSGNTFPSGALNRFEGRFVAFANTTPLEDASALPEAPGDGDTGTGTGTQT